MYDKTVRGYLNDNYKIFHINDKNFDYESHSHDFHKIIFCIRGYVTYIMEGKTYFLKANDMLLVPKNQIHRSKTQGDEEYERIVIWIKDEYLQMFCSKGLTLADCFNNICRQKFLSLNESKIQKIFSYINKIELSEKSDAFGCEIVKDTYFLRLMVDINRLVSEQESEETSYVSDPKFDEIIRYINMNITRELTVDSISSKFFISRSYFMHRFKEVTGYSVHNYITEKRLIRVVEKLKRGVPVLEAAHESGFKDYTVFYRNFKKMYGYCPNETGKKTNADI